MHTSRDEAWWVDWIERLFFARLLTLERLHVDALAFQARERTALTPAQQTAYDLISEAMQKLDAAVQVMTDTPGWASRKAEISRDIAAYLWKDEPRH